MSSRTRADFCCKALVQEVLRAPSSPLDPSVRALMEIRFGRDFSHVRLHADDLSADCARSLNASAFVAGSHIVIGKRRYNHGPEKDMWLLSHELAHVVQQRDQASTASFIIGDADDPLERTANLAVDAIAAGRSLPPDFLFGAAPAGVIQRHQDVDCPGVRIPAIERSTWMIANQEIEKAYKEDRRNRSHADAIFFGSQYETGRDVQLPKGAPNKDFGNALLRGLRGLIHQRRPDIIDFDLRRFYEIKTPSYAESGTVQVESYYRIADEIRLEYNRAQRKPAKEEPPWKIEYANWYPPHVLPFSIDMERIVCTKETNHNSRPALILYEVRLLDDEERRRRRLRRALSFELWDFETGFAELLPPIRAELPNKIRFYDPNNPNYVVIVPQEFEWEWYKQKNEKYWDKMRVEPSYDFPGGREVKGIRRLLLVSSAFVAGVAAVVILIAGGYALAAVAPAAVAAGGAAAGGGEVISLAAYRAMLAAPSVKYLAAAAGVVLVIGYVKDAQGATPSVERPSAVRAVAVADFQLDQGMLSATSCPAPPNSKVIQPDLAKHPFALGTKVLFDGKPHFIIGQISAGD